MEMFLPEMAVDDLLKIVHRTTPVVIYEENSETVIGKMTEGSPRLLFPRCVVTGIRVNDSGELMVICKRVL